MNWQTAVSVLSALLTPLIAVIATYIAWQQWRGNELKLRLDRYERRLRIYQEVVKMLGLISRDADAKIEDLWAFRANTAEAVFLFGPDVPNYLEEIFSRGLKLRAANRKYRHAGEETPPGYDHEKILAESNLELRWLTEQFDPAKQKFAKYLNVSE